MMRRFLLAASCAATLLAAPLAFAPSARAQTEAPTPPEHSWSWSGMFGTYDRGASQRGLQVYLDVCSNCHSMKDLTYGDLEHVGLTENQVKALAASIEVPGGVDSSGKPVMRPARPSDHFRSPYPNDAAARAANNGALPPDLSTIVKGRQGGADYIYAILTGYTDPPAGTHLAPGMSYNRYFPGHQIAMPKPLSDGQVTYADGTTASVPQMAGDVVTFLTWASHPDMEARERMGVKVVLFLVFMAIIAFVVKRRVWASAH